MLADADINRNFWSKAIATAAYLNNRSPKTDLDEKTPFQVWYNQKPEISHLWVFGSKAYALNLSRKKNLNTRPSIA